MDVTTDKDQEGEYVGTADSKTGRVQQRWIIKYVDKMANESKSGAGSRGFEIGKPF